MAVSRKSFADLLMPAKELVVILAVLQSWLGQQNFLDNPFVVLSNALHFVVAEAQFRTVVGTRRTTPTLLV